MKNTKQRLEELQDLLEGGYLTENEFRVARVNILKENGIDLTIHGRSLEERRGRQAEESPGGCGCGCFLAALFLAAAIGGAVWAIPQWPDRWGGAYVREVREWAVGLWSGFFGDSSESERSSESGVVSNPEEPSPKEPSPGEDSRGENSPGESIPRSLEPALDTAPPQASRDAEVPEGPTSPDAFSELDPPRPEAARSPSLPEGPSGLETPSLDDLNVTVVEIPASSFDFSAAEAALQKAALRKGFISARRARIRSAPDTSTGANVVGWGQSGDRFSVLDEGTSADGATWYRIRYETGDKQGWISGSLVTLE